MECFLDDGLSAECTSTVLETLAEGLMLIDTEGKIRFCNRALEKMTGLDRSVLIGRSCCSIMKEQCSTPPSCDLFTTGEITNEERTIRHLTGSDVLVLTNARALKNESGRIIGAVETLMDISALRSTETRLQQLQQGGGRGSGLGKLVGKSHGMRELFSLIELAAGSNVTVLLTGETGTGKELAAEAIHTHSARSEGPLVKINCSALPESLLESELFGHARGAFTGAMRDKPGRFEVADGGTLFLDEIGELTPLIQVKLLRFLQDREFERIGENHSRKTDVRIIAATHRDLRRLVAQGRFREDLYYRLKVFPLRLPPLRERKEDVGLLVDHFIAQFNRETGKRISGLTHDAAVTLMDYCWPGNIRELENAIEHAFVTCQEERIGLFDLPMEIRKVELRKGICGFGDDPVAIPMEPSYSNPSSPDVLYPGRSRISDDTFRKVLEECGYNKSEAARRLGIDRTTVWRRIRRLGSRREG